MRTVVNTALVREQLDLPAGSLACVIQGALDEQPSHASPAVSVGDDNSLDERRGPAAVREMGHEHRGCRAHWVLVAPGIVVVLEVHQLDGDVGRPRHTGQGRTRAVTRLTHQRELFRRLGLILREHVQDRRQIRSCCLPHSVGGSGVTQSWIETPCSGTAEARDWCRSPIRRGTGVLGFGGSRPQPPPAPAPTLLTGADAQSRTVPPGRADATFEPTDRRHGAPPHAGRRRPGPEPVRATTRRP